MTTSDTIALILRTVKTFSNSPWIKKVVEILSVGNPDEQEFCKRLFEVACKLVKYERDPRGHEIVFTPKLLVEVGQGDCKKFTTLIMSVLEAKGIRDAAKVVSYAGRDWEHIYVIVPLPSGSYITLDPVNHCKFNSEVKHSKAQLFYTNGTKSEIMDGNRLSLMGSLGNLSTSKLFKDVSDSAAQVLGDASESFGGTRDGLRSCYNRHSMAGLGNDYMDGIFDENEYGPEISKKGKGPAPKFIKKIAAKTKSAVQKTKSNVHTAAQKHKTKTAARRTARKAAAPAKKAARKEKRKKIFKGVKKVGMAPARGAFLGLLLLGRALEKTPIKINLAAHMAKQWQQDDGAALTKVWENFGGKRESLRAALAKAAHTQLNGQDIQWNRDGSIYLEGIGSIGVVAEAATAIALSAPIVIAVTKLLKDKNVTSDLEAEVVEDVTEATEDKAMDEAGGDAAKYLHQQTKKAAKSALIKKAAEIDDGGNEATQREMITDAASEPMEEPPETASENFTSEGFSENEQDSGGNFKTAAKKTGGSPAARTNTATDQQSDAPTKNLPATADQFAPRAASMLGNYKSPHTWLKAMLMLMPFQDYAVAPYAGGLCFVAFVASSIHFTYQSIFHSAKII